MSTIENLHRQLSEKQCELDDVLRQVHELRDGNLILAGEIAQLRQMLDWYNARKV